MASITVFVNELPAVSIDDVEDQCVNGAAITLSGSPGEGTFSGPGVVGTNMFDPAVAGEGVSTVTYTYTDANGCTNTADVDITVNPRPHTDDRPPWARSVREMSRSCFRPTSRAAPSMAPVLAEARSTRPLPRQA